MIQPMSMPRLRNGSRIRPGRVSIVKASQLTLMCSRAEWCFSNSMEPEHHLGALLSCRFGFNRLEVGPRFSISNRHPGVLALLAALGVTSLQYHKSYIFLKKDSYPSGKEKGWEGQIWQRENQLFAQNCETLRGAAVRLL